jgi:hypothetical protein
MISEAPVARGGCALASACTEFMGGPDKPGHDGEGGESAFRIHLDAG